MKLNNFMTIVFSLFILLIINSSASAQDAAGAAASLQSVLNIMMIIVGLIIVFILWLVLVYSEKNDNDGKLFKEPLSLLNKLITRATPVEKENEILMNHDYDGIKELDNHIPPWFLALFYGTIIFAMIYMVRFHIVGTGNTQSEEYNEEIRIATIEKQILIKTGALLTEENITQLNSPADLSAGKETFLKNCTTCHGQNAEGLVGPNLTDNFWINGGGIKNIFKTIKNGVAGKGMISWQTQLPPKKIQEVASFIISLKGTNPPNAKLPQGTEWIEPITDPNQKTL